MIEAHQKICGRMNGAGFPACPTLLSGQAAALRDHVQAPHVVGGSTGVLTGDCLPTPPLAQP
ncbi:MAG TPA: hypothetical protein VMY80_09775 [Anaerolineae bacterium]|nr:hypothetical protein [Anaerolineae bacterium]